MAERPKTLLFLDIETTGLKKQAQLLELAAILVRAHDLEEVSRFRVLVQSLAGVSMDTIWDPFVVAMHSKNGLLADIADPKNKAVEGNYAALQAFAAWLKSVGQPTKGCYIAGSSVHTDIAFLKAIDTPSEGGVTDVDWNGFSHRILDLSSLRTFDIMTASGLYPSQKPDDTHRAMNDCEQDLAQLRIAVQSEKARLKTLMGGPCST